MAQHHKMEYDIFISYSRKDFNEVKALYEMLKSRISNINIWFDLTGIESGDEFDEKIIAAINDSKMLLFALSDNSMQSKYAKDEVMYAKNTEKRIIPVLMKGACLKDWFLFKFGRIDCIDLQDEKQVNKMLNNFSQWFDKKLVNEPASSPKVSQSQQTSAAKSATALSPEEMFQNGTWHYDKKNYAKAIEWYRRAAEQGYAPAQFSLGVCYNYGHSVTQDFAEAAKWYRKAAEQGFAKAQNSLGFCYENGEGVTKDILEAVNWYRKAAEQGQTNAKSNLKRLRYSESFGGSTGNIPKKGTKAYGYYEKAINGDAIGQYSLGVCYEKGHSIDKNYYAAVKWYHKAAEQGFAAAQCNLGYCYDEGHGVTKDSTEAVKWYQKAAEQGFAKAQCILGHCYDEGHGITKDSTEAVKWYRKAAEQDYTDAQYNLGCCYYIGDGVTQNYFEATKWWLKAAMQGNAKAQCNLGVCYEVGKGVTQNITEAVKWYRKAAAQGNSDAKDNLKRLGYSE